MDCCLRVTVKIKSQMLRFPSKFVKRHCEKALSESIIAFHVRKCYHLKRPAYFQTELQFCAHFSLGDESMIQHWFSRCAIRGLNDTSAPVNQC